VWGPHPTTEALRARPHRAHASGAAHSLHWPQVRMALWSRRVHIRQHGMRARSSAWWLVRHPDGGTSWASGKARRHKGLTVRSHHTVRGRRLRVRRALGTRRTLEKARWHWSSWHAVTRGHPSHHRTGGCCCTIVMEGFRFTGVVTCLSPLWRSTIQVPEYTPPGMQESRGFSECYVFLPSYL